jgi:hypothetical protein
MAVTVYQEKRIRALRQRGVGYRTIAAELGISRDTVRNFCTAHDLSGVAGKLPVQDGNVCPQCGGEIIQPRRGRRRRFCTDACCRSWWAAHPEAIRQSPEAQHHLQCVYCGKEFIVYGSASRRYCSHNCYIRDRFWRAEEGREPYAASKTHRITP